MRSTKSTNTLRQLVWNRLHGVGPIAGYSKQLLSIALSIFIISSAAFSQVDTTFSPTPSRLSQFAGEFKVQPDGKIIVFGSFQIVQGIMKNGIARLHPNGTLDNSFTCTICDFNVGSIVIQPDGKLVVAGSKTDTGGARIRRLNPDGSMDASFTAPFPENPDGFEPRNHIWAIRPDGKMYVSQRFSYMGDPWSYLYRLNADGSIDGSFTRLYFSWGIGQFGEKHVLADLKLLPDGDILIGGKHSYGFLFRVNPDGTKDDTFQSPVLTSNAFNPTLLVDRFEIQADGKIALVGFFEYINGVQKNGFARLNANQTVDTSYAYPAGTPVGGSSVQKLELQPDGKLLVSRNRIVRLNTDGTLDNTFTAPSTLTATHAWAQDGSGKILVVGNFSGEGSKLARLNSDGTRDETINVTFGIPPATLYASTVTADGKVVFTGGFTLVDGVARERVARVNADGTLDTSFNAGTGFSSDVYDLVAQPDGKIIAGGIFTSVNGTPRHTIARLNIDGSVDTGFNPVLSDTTVTAATAALAVQPDGKILIGGEFDSVNGIARTGLARLNPDGSLDTSFNPVLGGVAVTLVLMVQDDRKIMVGGIFSSVNGVARPSFARLNSDGSLDASFDPVGNFGDVRILDRQADGKYLTSNTNDVRRRNIDGSLDSSFQTIVFDNQSTLRTIRAQVDGTILVGGTFEWVGNNSTKKYLVQLQANGTLRTDFLPAGINSSVYALTTQADNKVIAVGDFTSIGGLTRFKIARLNSPVARKVLFDFDGDGRSDISVFRPSENKWYVLRSSDLGVTQQIFALAGDVVVPSDFDGDSRTDVAIYRPSAGQWWYLSSLNGTQNGAPFGNAGAIPLPSDFDGDGKSDHVFFLPSNSTWYRHGSTVGASNATFGIAGDKPVIGDFDGDGKSDLAIYRPSSGEWWYAASSAGGQHRAGRWGISSDIPTPADYDGDGKTDFAVYRPSNGGWYIINSSTGLSTIVGFGLPEDKPVAADYDGDGKADMAVFRPSTGIWYLMRSTSGFSAVHFGISTDIPTPNAFVP